MAGYGEMGGRLVVGDKGVIAAASFIAPAVTEKGATDNGMVGVDDGVYQVGGVRGMVEGPIVDVEGETIGEEYKGRVVVGVFVGRNGDAPIPVGRCMVVGGDVATETGTGGELGRTGGATGEAMSGRGLVI